MLPRAAPTLPATYPVGHKELPNCPTRPQPPSLRAGREGREREAAAARQAPSGRWAFPRQFPHRQLPLALRPGRAAPLTPQQPWCPALSGYRPSWGEARAFSAAHSAAEPSVTLPPSTAASAHSKDHVCLPGRCFAVLQGPGRWQRAVPVAQPPPCPAMTPGRHRLRLAAGFVTLSV